MTTKIQHIPAPKKMSSRGKYLKNIVYGGIDGIITTFAVVAGGAGAALSGGILLMLGLANLFADGFSMAFGEFASSRAEDEYYKKEKSYELHMLAQNPNKVKANITSHYVKKGFDDIEAEKIANLLMQSPSAAVEILLTERDVTKSSGSLWAKSIYTFFAFLFFGSFPLITYVIVPFVPEIQPHTFAMAATFTAATLFGLGATKALFTDRSWYYSGFEMLCMGGVSAVAAYTIGEALSWLAK
jgi:VIT1/CCC1 family predicted Fe2+/Mn2+ transporter